MVRASYSHNAGLIGVFSRGPPSKYQPAASSGSVTRTAGNNAGIAEDASICSAPSSGVATYSIPHSGSSWCCGIPHALAGAALDPYPPLVAFPHVASAARKACARPGPAVDRCSPPLHLLVRAQGAFGGPRLWPASWLRGQSQRQYS
jgi:hypothetical protein